MRDLHSTDVWDIDSPDGVTPLLEIARSSDPSKSSVVKIVIGPSPGSDGGDRSKWMSADLSSLSHIEWESFPRLTHLYLWSIQGLTEVRSLPPKLECLDLRGCAKLCSLPDRLPDTLETLDLHGCASLAALPDPLPAGLAELYLEGCVSLTSLEPVFALVGDGVPLPDAAPPADRPPGLRTLVLHNAATPGLPTGFGGEAGENVAPRLRAYLRELRGGIAHLAECKVIVVGDGGHGKTSLVKALKGDPHDPEEKYTHRIRLWNWDGAYRDESFYPFPDKADITARINIWDFGGQDIYHNSHRMFLESRAVFLVVWRPPAPDGAPARREFPDDPWRNLDYWLDQILIPNPQARVLVVQTRYDEDGEKDWRATVREEYRSLPGYVVSCCDREMTTPETKTLADLRGRLRDEIRSLLASLNANQLPRPWVTVREGLARWQPTSDDVGAVPQRSAKPTMSWSEFCRFARETYRQIEAVPPSDTDLQSLARYLHDIGVILFPKAWRDGKRHRPVVIDQRWAIEGVYVMETEHRIRTSIEQPFGEVSRSALTAFWKQAQPNTDPDEWWVWEQCMLSSGVMIDVTGERDRERRYIFPDFLPARDRMESDLAGLPGFVPKLCDSSIHRIVDEAGHQRSFDKGFACRLVGRFRSRVREDFRAFRYGGIVPFFDRPSPAADGAADDRRIESSGRPPVIVATIEWKRINNASFGFIQVDFLGDMAKRALAEKEVLEWVRQASGESVSLRLEPALADESDTDGDAPSPGADERESAVVAGVAPRDQVIHVAISYAGNPPANGEGDSATDRVDLEYLPHRLKDLIDRDPRSKCRVTAYKHGEQNDTHRPLPAYIHSLANGAIVIAVVSKKYLYSKDCLTEFLLATKRDRTWEDSFPHEATTTPPWVERVWVAAIDAEMRSAMPQVWAQVHFDIALEQRGKLESLQSFAYAGGRKINETMKTSQGGVWLAEVYEQGATSVALLLSNMQRNFPKWKVWRSDQVDQMAVTLAQCVLAEAAAIFNEMDTSQRQETVKKRMLDAWNSAMRETACEEFETFVEQIQDAAERERFLNGQSDDDEVNAVAKRWRAKRQVT